MWLHGISKDFHDTCYEYLQGTIRVFLVSSYRIEKHVNMINYSLVSFETFLSSLRIFLIFRIIVWLPSFTRLVGITGELC